MSNTQKLWREKILSENENATAGCCLYFFLPFPLPNVKKISVLPCFCTHTKFLHSSFIAGLFLITKTVKIFFLFSSTSHQASQTPIYTNTTVMNRTQLKPQVKEKKLKMSKT